MYSGTTPLLVGLRVCTRGQHRCLWVCACVLGDNSVAYGSARAYSGTIPLLMGLRVPTRGQYRACGFARAYSGTIPCLWVCACVLVALASLEVSQSA